MKEKIFQLTGVLCLCAAWGWAQDDFSARRQGVPEIHYRQTAADLEAARQARGLSPVPSSQYQYQQPYVPSMPQSQSAYPSAYNSSTRSRAAQPLTADQLRPRRPPEFVDFGDEFSEIVAAYIEEQSKKNKGVFVVKDNQGGGYHYLKMSHIYRDRITRGSPTEVFGCVEFERVKGGNSKLDLDFYLNNEDWEWKISKLLIHKVDGQARFHYNSDYQIVALGPRVAPAVGKPTRAVVPKPKAPAKLDVAVVFREPSGRNALYGADKGELLVTVTNMGAGEAFAVRVIPALQGDVPGLNVPGEVILGDLAPGKKVHASVPLEASADLRSQKARIRLSVNEGNGFDADPVLVEFKTKAAKPPRLELAGVKVGASGVVKAGEATPLTVSIKNSGTGPADGVEASLSLGSPDIFMSGEPSFHVGLLKPGQSKNLNFEFFINKRYKTNGPLPITLTIKESRNKYNVLDRPLNLVLGKPAPVLQVVSVEASPETAEASEAGADEDVDILPAAKVPRDPEAFAVVIGIEKYRDVPAVEFAGRDAQTFYHYLTGSMGFDPKNVIHLENERATRTDLSTYLGPWLKDRVTPKSRVVIYYSGHGAPNPASGESFMIPYDGNPNYTETTAFSLKQLYENLAGLPAKDVTVILDSCFSGTGGRSLIAKGTRPLVNMKTTAVGDNTLVISASQGSQISTYNPDAQHGMMTYYLLRGLKGEADRDKNSRITTEEIFGYLKPAVEREARKQHVEQSPGIVPPLESLGKRSSQVWLQLD